MKAYIVGPKGGAFAFADPDSGEVTRETYLAPGMHPLASLVRFRRGREEIVLHGGYWQETAGNFETCKPVGQFESAANPNFRVSPAARQLREMRRMMQRTEALSKRTEKALSAMKRAKAAPPPAQIEVSENVTLPDDPEVSAS